MFPISQDIRTDLALNRVTSSTFASCKLTGKLSCSGSDTWILLKAADFPAGSLERLVHVACFAVSGYAATGKRTSKPFNPLLGETYEFVCPEKSFRFISEKACISPTCSC